MNTLQLKVVAQDMVADNKGLLAMDESNPTINKRFAALNTPQTEEMRRSYRQMLITTPNLEDSISGVILYDETIHQKLDNGLSFIEAVNKKE